MKSYLVDAIWTKLDSHVLQVIISLVVSWVCLKGHISGLNSPNPPLLTSKCVLCKLVLFFIPHGEETHIVLLCSRIESTKR